MGTIPRCSPSPLPRRVRAAAGRLGILSGLVLLLVPVAVSLAPPARALPSPVLPSVAAQNAARVALDRGDRTGVALLNLRTGDYIGAGEDTGTFPSESVVKVFIAVQLLLSGQMSGTVESTAYRMITTSDDGAASALYDRAGGDDVVTAVGAHYGIAGLGTPPSTPGRWGLTGVNARGLVQLYAAIAKDPAVYPWLSNAMAHAARVASDGTDQFFGLPSASPGAAVKQGWGHDGIDTGHAVTNSTGYVDGGRFAVAILTAGPADTYGSAIQSTVTAQARALLAAVTAVTAGLPAASPVVPPTAGTAIPVAADSGTSAAALARLGVLAASAAAGGVALYGGRRLQLRLRNWRADRRARRRRRRAGRRRTSSSGPRPVLVRLPSGQLLRVSAAPARRPTAAAGRPAAVRSAGSRPPVRISVAVPA